jgi:hypothetical protein
LPKFRRTTRDSRGRSRHGTTETAGGGRHNPQSTGSGWYNSKFSVGTALVKQAKRRQYQRFTDGGNSWTFSSQEIIFEQFLLARR